MPNFATCRFAAILALSPVLAAQCGNVWLPGDGLPTTNGVVMAATRWDPDGAGPATERLVIAGDFSVAGNVTARRIAAFDPATGLWTAFGAGLDNLVRAVTALPNGDLIAGGDFTTSGGAAAAHIARWDGAAWQPIGGGISGPIYVQAVAANGDLIAGGRFAQAGGSSASCVARWNGTAWSALGSGLAAGTFLGAYALLPLANGDVVVGGEFTLAGNAPANNIARWNGSTWSPLGAGVDAAVLALAQRSSGDIIAGGNFVNAGSVYTQYNARWNGTAWVGLPWLGSPATAMLTDANGNVAIATGNALLSYDGVTTTWDSTGPNGPVRALCTLSGGDLVAGGSFLSSGGRNIPNLTRRTANGWQPVAGGGPLPGSGIEGFVSVVAIMPNGDLVAGGSFTLAGGQLVSNIARRVGNTWQPLGTGVNGQVTALLVLPNGDLVVGGAFQSAGGVAANRIARWDGVGWSAFGSGVDGTASQVAVWSLLALPNGDLIAGGNFQTAGGASANSVARWDGVAWSPLGLGLSGGSFIFETGVTSLVRMANGDLVAGGSFPFIDGVIANGTVARWNGSSWTNLNGPTGQVTSMATLTNGDLVASQSSIFLSGSTSVWNGSTWSPLPGAPTGVRSMLRLPDGDLLVGGGTADPIQRWNGTTWTIPAVSPDQGVTALASGRDGDVAVCGYFESIGATASHRVARLTTTCPATATSFGQGCTGSNGANLLTATALPWLGGASAVRATGMPLNGLALRELGLAPAALPLVQILPQAGPGCILYVPPLVADLRVPQAGVIDDSFAIPDSMALVGFVLLEQFVAFDIAQGAIAQITSTNALTLTIGAF